MKKIIVSLFLLFGALFVSITYAEDQVFPVNAENCSMLQNHFPTDYTDAVADLTKSRPFVPFFQRFRFDQSTSRCLVEVNTKTAPYVCYVDRIVLGKWENPNRASWRFPDPVDGKVECVIDQSRKRNYRDGTLRKYSDYQTKSKLIVSTIFKITNLGAGRSQNCPIEGYNEIRNRLINEITYRGLLANVCGVGAGNQTSEIERRAQATASYYSGCFTADAKVQYQTVINNYFEQISKDCSSADAKDLLDRMNLVSK